MGTTVAYTAHCVCIAVRAVASMHLTLTNLHACKQALPSHCQSLHHATTVLRVMQRMTTST
jgi:hypothetical protein